jgi:NACHT domain
MQPERIKKPDPEGGPFAELAMGLYELYEAAGCPSTRELAEAGGLRKPLSTATVKKIIQGTGRWRWHTGRRMIRIGLLREERGIDEWERRWQEADRQQTEIEANGGVEPLPWVDDDDGPTPIEEHAVDDWNRRHGLPPRLRQRLQRAAFGLSALAIAALTVVLVPGRWWVTAMVATALMTVLITTWMIVSRRGRRAAPQWWQRQIILGPVIDRAADLLDSYEKGPRLPARFVHFHRSLPTPNNSDKKQRNKATAARGAPDGDPYPDGTTVLEVFEDAAQTLVLISEAGMGKTTQLALLTRELAQRALATPRGQRAVLPFLISLSTYRGQSFDDWLVTEINTAYRIHPTLVRGLLAATTPGNVSGDQDADGVLLLLDGLDEIPNRKHQEACADHLQQFRQRCAGLVVTCRNRDLKLAARIEASRHVMIDKPDRPAVQRYLATNAEALADVRATLKTAPESSRLWDLLQSPLWLQIISHTYANRPAAELRQPGTTEEERKKREEGILDAYIGRMLNHRRTRYSHHKTLTWLTWLARTLTQRDGQILYLDRLDHTWPIATNGSVTRSASPVFAGVLAGAVLGLATLVIGVAFGLVERIGYAIVGVGYLPWFVAIKAAHGRELYGLQPVEQLRWSWALLRRADDGSRATRGRDFGLGFGDGAVAAMVLGSFYPGGFNFSVWLALTPMVVIWITVHSLTDSNFVPGLREQRSEPNEGIRRSFRHALVSGSILALPLSLYFTTFMYLLGGPFGHLLFMGTVLGLTYGLGRAFQLGGSACVCYWTTRIRMRRSGSAPLRYKRFLHDAEQRILLRRVGSGFSFPHRLLQEHLGTMPDERLKRLTLNGTETVGD